MAQRIDVEGATAEQISRSGHPIVADVLQLPEAGAGDVARDHVEGGYQKAFTPSANDTRS